MVLPWLVSRCRSPRPGHRRIDPDQSRHPADRERLRGQPPPLPLPVSLAPIDARDHPLCAHRQTRHVHPDGWVPACPSTPICRRDARWPRVWLITTLGTPESPRIYQRWCGPSTTGDRRRNRLRLAMILALGGCCFGGDPQTEQEVERSPDQLAQLPFSPQSSFVALWGNDAGEPPCRRHALGNGVCFR